MLYVSKKTDYALIALAFLAERVGRVASAREIAEAHQISAALLMNILKMLQKNGVVHSTRGARGGYQLNGRLNDVSLYQLMGILETDAAEDGHECCDQLTRYKVTRESPMHQPVVALQYKLIRFLQDVKLSDLVMPGRRIDVPVEMVRITEKSKVLASAVPVNS
jgi:Rrf2 family protein